MARPKWIIYFCVLPYEGPSGQGRALRLAELGCLPLTYLSPAFAPVRRFNLAVPILIAAVVLIFLEIVMVAVGFFAAALLLVMMRHLTLREAYEARSTGRS